MSHADDVWIRTLGLLALGSEFGPRDKTRKMLESMWKHSPIRKRTEAAWRRLSDAQFEEANAKLDALPSILRQSLSEGIGKLPANRGGRPPAFPIEVRRRAIEDLGHELPRTNSFSEAVNIVSARYGMPPDYVRKVWKNRKRLNQGLTIPTANRTK